jgi:DNA-binding HxlR family transcriptional regulator
MVGSAIWTMEKSRITMNWAVTSNPRIRFNRWGAPGPSAFFGVAKMEIAIKSIFINQSGKKSIAFSMAQRHSESTSQKPISSRVPFKSCPIRASLDLGYLGRKWALVVLRDVAFSRDMTFGQILRKNSGLTPRALSMRLRDLQTEGVIRRVADATDSRKVHYRLTRQGEDAVPILTALVQYGIRHHSDKVFEDKRPRELETLYPGNQEFMLGRLERFAMKAVR